MKAKSLVLVINFVLFFLTNNIYAYEIATHEQITENAVKTVLQYRDFLNDIELKIEDKLEVTEPFAGPSCDEDCGNRSILNWMRYGSEMEDNDYFDKVGRYRNHYYDPEYDRGLEFSVMVLGKEVPLNGLRAPEWGLDIDRYSNNELSGQNYSVVDARKYFKLGLVSQNKRERDRHLARTFKALGHVVHLMQDMMQPQHTRNDAHGGNFLGKEWGYQIFGEKSMYEDYVEKNFNKMQWFSLPLPYIPTFGSYMDYFVSSDGRGASNFSNTNFITAGTNSWKWVNCNPQDDTGICFNLPYILPVLNLAFKDEVPANTLNPRLEPDEIVTFFKNAVNDKYDPAKSVINSKMTTYSYFAKDLLQKGKEPLFTLNTYNYDEAAKILLPHAVAYSAGLINYFFRGEIDMKPVDGSQSNFEIFNNSTEEMNGTFSLYYDKKNGERVKAAEWTTTSMPANGSMIVSYTPPADYEPQNLNKYMLVFDGRLGNEDRAVAGKVIDLNIIPASRSVKLGKWSGGGIEVLTKSGKITGQLPQEGLSYIIAVRFDQQDWNTFYVLSIYTVDGKGVYRYHKYSIDEAGMTLNYGGVFKEENYSEFFSNIYEVLSVGDINADLKEARFKSTVEHSYQQIYDFYVSGGTIKPFGYSVKENITTVDDGQCTLDETECYSIVPAGILEYVAQRKLFFGSIMKESTTANCTGGYYNGKVVECTNRGTDPEIRPLAIFNNTDYAYRYGSELVSTLDVTIPFYITQPNYYIRTMMRETGNYSYTTGSSTEPQLSYSSEVGTIECGGFLLTGIKYGNYYVGWRDGRTVIFKNCSDWKSLGGGFIQTDHQSIFDAIIRKE